MPFSKTTVYLPKTLVLPMTSSNSKVCMRVFVRVEILRVYKFLGLWREVFVNSQGSFAKKKIQINTHLHTHVYEYTHTYVRAYRHTHTHMHIQTYIPTRLARYTIMSTYRSNTHTLIHTRTNIHIHANMHTQSHTCILFSTIGDIQNDVERKSHSATQFKPYDAPAPRSFRPQRCKTQRGVYSVIHRSINLE